jgi:hypothetical protein
MTLLTLSLITSVIEKVVINNSGDYNWINTTHNASNLIQVTKALCKLNKMKSIDINL